MARGAVRRDEAVALRVAGHSRSQISRIMGVRSSKMLCEWLRDVPPPEWTRRPTAKDDLRAVAVALRQEGRSYREIGEVVPVARSTLSLWLRDVALTDEQRGALGERNVSASQKRAAANRARRVRRDEEIVATARAQIPVLAQSDLFVAGVVAYWAEGTKNKPWRSGCRVTFLNSDVDMIRLFVAWLALVGVTRNRIRWRLHIHESADEGAALRYWSAALGVPEECFSRSTLKRHNPSTTRKNVGDGYHGCLAVTVTRSAVLNLEIAGWWQGIVATAETTAGGDVTLDDRSGVE